MSTPSPLEGFAYGEHLEGPHRRSLGFRLLTPTDVHSWAGEVEALARRLQAAPYPDSWPLADLFASVILADGRRVVAVARYGLADHTPGQRRGGLELVGVVGPGDLSVTAALAIYEWLKIRRASGDDLTSLGGTYDLIQVLAEAPTPPAAGDPVPVLPVRLWQDGALLFAAAAPNDPDRRLGMLEPAAAKWQWLPLVGADFPLADYARRGPVVAWTPQAAPPVKIERPIEPLVPVPAVTRRASWLSRLATLLGLIVMGANIWLLAEVRKRLSIPLPPSQPVLVAVEPPAAKAPPPVGADRERFARAIHRWLERQGALRDGKPEDLLRQYERLVERDEDIRVESPEARQAIGALAVLIRRSPAQVEAAIRDATGHRGYDPELIGLISRRVYERLTDPKDAP